MPGRISSSRSWQQQRQQPQQQQPRACEDGECRRRQQQQDHAHGEATDAAGWASGVWAAAAGCGCAGSPGGSACALHRADKLTGQCCGKVRCSTYNTLQISCAHGYAMLLDTQHPTNSQALLHCHITHIMQQSDALLSPHNTIMLGRCRCVEEALVSAFTEARRSAPAVIYWPQVCTVQLPTEQHSKSTHHTMHRPPGCTHR